MKNLLAKLYNLRYIINKLDTANVSTTRQRILEELDTIDGILDNKITIPITIQQPVKLWFVKLNLDIRAVVWYNVKDGTHGVVVHSYKF